MYSATTVLIPPIAKALQSSLAATVVSATIVPVHIWSVATCEAVEVVSSAQVKVTG